MSTVSTARRILMEETDEMREDSSPENCEMTVITKKDYVAQDR